MLTPVKTGATTAAIVATFTLMVACASVPPRSPQQLRSDDVTADLVYSALVADPTYYYRHVDVHVYDGVAHLSGYVWDTDAMYRAKKIAASVPGVTNVVNQMELERDSVRGGGTSHNG